MNKKQKEQYEKYMATGIYFVTVIEPKIVRRRHSLGIDKGKLYWSVSHGGKRPTNSRCWGWYKKLKDAVTAIEENHLDIFEGSYTHAVIEKVPNGVCPMSKEVQWFKWCVNIDLKTKKPNIDKWQGKYVKCEKPEWSNGICNWSI